MVFRGSYPGDKLDEPIAEINAPELLAVVRRIEDRALDTAHRTLQNCGQVFRYAVAAGRAGRDPTGDLRGALPPRRKRHHASITDIKRIGDLMRAIRGYEGSLVTRCALRLAQLSGFSRDFEELKEKFA